MAPLNCGRFPASHHLSTTPLREGKAVRSRLVGGQGNEEALAPKRELDHAAAVRRVGVGLVPMREGERMGV